MKGKKISPCIVIDSTLQNLRTELIERGRALQELLRKPFPSADAVLTAISSIHNLLHHEGRICNVWVTAHVKEDNTHRYITNKEVRAVSILFHLLLRLYVIYMCLINLVLLR
jgi:hypothetical protein